MLNTSIETWGKGSMDRGEHRAEIVEHAASVYSKVADLLQLFSKPGLQASEISSSNLVKLTSSILADLVEGRSYHC